MTHAKELETTGSQVKDPQARDKLGDKWKKLRKWEKMEKYWETSKKQMGDK